MYLVINMRIGLLTNPNPIFGTELIKALKKRNILIESIIVDKKLTTTKDIDIHNERTNNKYVVKTIFKQDNTNANIVYVDNHNSKEVVKLIKETNLDLLLNGYTPRILDTNILTSTPLGVLNCHPGILPDFRGCMAVEWSIFYNKPVGNTIHWMTAGIDEGPIIVSRKSDINLEMSYEKIRTKVQLDGINLFAETVKKCILKKISWTGITQKNGTYYKPMNNDAFNDVKNKINKKIYISKEL